MGISWMQAFLNQSSDASLNTLPESDWLHWVDCLAESTSIEPFVLAKIDKEINAGFLMDELSEEYLMAEVVKDEEKEGPEPQKASGLQIAARIGLLGIMQDLIQNGDDVNEESSADIRPIHEAARVGYAKVIELLLAEGAFTEVF